MKLKVLISEGEDGWLVVQCPSIPGCISQGRNLKEALDNIKEAIEGCLEVMEERIKEIGGKRLKLICFERKS
jgi:predicted RNase H-like HicB family nuclease